MSRTRFDEVLHRIAQSAFRDEYGEKGYVSALRRFVPRIDRTRGDALEVEVRLESGLNKIFQLGHIHDFRDEEHIWIELAAEFDSTLLEYLPRRRPRHHPRFLFNRVADIFGRVREDVALWAECQVFERQFIETINRTTDPHQIMRAREIRDDAIRRTREHFSRHDYFTRTVDFGGRSGWRRDDTVDAFAYTMQRTDRAELRNIPPLPPEQTAALQRRMDRELRALLHGTFPTEESPERVAAREAAQKAEQQRRQEAQARGMKLLRENLSPAQLAEYDQHKYFHVIGGQTKTRYRILHGRQINIRVLDEQGRITAKLCFLPRGDLVEGDVMLAQKLALELQEKAALKVANRFPGDVDPRDYERADNPLLRRGMTQNPVINRNGPMYMAWDT